MNEERVDSAEKQYSDAVSQKRKMTELLEDENFKFFISLLQAQTDKRIHEMLVMPTGMDDAVRRIYSNGEVAGLKIAINFPQILIDGSQGTIDMIKRVNELKEGNENG